MSFDASKYTKSRWLKGSDIPHGQQLRLTIKAAFEHTFEEQQQTKPVLSFLEIPQELPLNKTQTATMISAYGPAADLWAGQPVVLSATPSNFAGKPTITINTTVSAPVPTATAHGFHNQQQPLNLPPNLNQSLSAAAPPANPDVIFGPPDR